MQWLIDLLRWLFKDKRSEREVRREREFIDAANKLKSLMVTERGGLFLNSEELRDQIEKSRETLKHLVDPAHRGRDEISLPANPVQLPEGTQHACFTQVITWRRLPSNAAIRYVCLQGLNAEKFTIAATDYFSSDEKLSNSKSFEDRIAQRIQTTDCADPLQWFDSLNEAIDAHDASI